MTYRDYILALPDQFKYQPEIINPENLKLFKHIVICGMGGSRLAPDILATLYPELDVRVYSDGPVPVLPQGYAMETLFVANSHSGNTQETLAFAQEILNQKLNLAVVTCGGKLQEFSEKYSISHIITPTTGEPARLGIGYDFVALSHLVGKEIPQHLDNPVSEDFHSHASDLSEFLAGGIPVVYAPDGSNALGYIWKIVLNETAKIPAFCNRYPELFHNEIASFDADLAKQFRWIILRDKKSSDVERVNALIRLMQDKGLKVITSDLIQASPSEVLFNSAILAHLTALALAEKNGVDPLATTAIEEFKNSTR